LVSAIEEILRVAVRLAAAFLASVALLATSASATYADSSPLYSRLAPAPGADWVEAASTPTTLEGPFSSHAYANFLQTVSPSTPSVAGQLDALAFRSGYARTWVQTSTNDQLTERVFEFDDALGASAWYANLKQQNQFTKYLARTIPPLDGDVDSFGVVLKTPDYSSYRVEFVVSKLVFTVHMDSAKNDLTDVVVGQALAELHREAAAAIGSRAIAHPARPRLPLGEVGLAVTLVAVAAAVIGWRRHRRSHPRF
jgi:hypothetical protein